MLNVITGATIHDCMPRHRHQDFLKFLRKVERSVEPGLEIHIILDNYATHTHEKVRKWLKRMKRVRLHFIPTGASWLNMVERLFSELTERQLKRLAVHRVPELEAVVMRYLDDRNDQPGPFVWTKSAVQIIEKLERGLRTLESVHQAVRPSRSTLGADESRQIAQHDRQQPRQKRARVLRARLLGRRAELARV